MERASICGFRCAFQTLLNVQLAVGCGHMRGALSRDADFGPRSMTGRPVDARIRSTGADVVALKSRSGETTIAALELTVRTWRLGVQYRRSGVPVPQRNWRGQVLDLGGIDDVSTAATIGSRSLILILAAIHPTSS
jgi:hypothetical protein